MNKDDEEKLIKQIDSLPLDEQEKEILKMSFGIGVEKYFTVEELMRFFNLTKEQIWQIKRKALRLIRHPRRKFKLKDFIEEAEKQNELLHEKLDNEITVGKIYTEKELNAILKECCTSQDYVSFRRDLIDKGYLCRTNDCRKYWRNINEGDAGVTGTRII